LQTGVISPLQVRVAEGDLWKITRFAAAKCIAAQNSEQNARCFRGGSALEFELVVRGGGSDE
jgi:hypothetical protein